MSQLTNDIWLKLLLVQSIIGLVVLTSFLSDITKKKLNKLISFILIIPIVFILEYLFFFNLSYSVINTLEIFINFWIIGAWLIICSKDRSAVSIFICLTILNIITAVNLFSLVICLNGSLKYLLPKFFMCRLIMFIILSIIFIKIRTPFRKSINYLNNEWSFLSIIPLCFILIQFFLVYYPVMYYLRDGYNMIVIIIVYCLFISIYIILIYLINALIQRNMLKNNENLLLYQYSLWEKEINRIEEKSKETRFRNHDIKHHKIIFKQFLLQNNIESALSYLDVLDNNIEQEEQILFCSNTVINNLLIYNHNRAIRECIKLEICACVPNNLNIDSINLVIILANIIENAVEACLRIPVEKRLINLTIKYVNNKILINVRNSCIAGTKFVNELPVSLKEKGGLGLKSILFAVEKNGGYARFIEEDGMFLSIVVLND